MVQTGEKIMNDSLIYSLRCFKGPKGTGISFTVSFIDWCEIVLPFFSFKRLELIQGAAFALGTFLLVNAAT